MCFDQIEDAYRRDNVIRIMWNTDLDKDVAYDEFESAGMQDNDIRRKGGLHVLSYNTEKNYYYGQEKIMEHYR